MQCALQTRALRGFTPFKSHAQRKMLSSPARSMFCRAKTGLQLEGQAEGQQHLARDLDLATLSLAGLLLQPMAAWADEAAREAPAAAEAAAASVSDAAQSSVEAPAWFAWLLVLSPIILYALFNIYRSQVNPRAKFTDFLFIFAGVAVVANLVSILTVHIRLF